MESIHTQNLKDGLVILNTYKVQEVFNGISSAFHNSMLVYQTIYNAFILLNKFDNYFSIS